MSAATWCLRPRDVYGHVMSQAPRLLTCISPHRRGVLQVLLELRPYYTSKEHDWFKFSSGQTPTSETKYDVYYVWAHQVCPVHSCTVRLVALWFVMFITYGLSCVLKCAVLVDGLLYAAVNVDERAVLVDGFVVCCRDSRRARCVSAGRLRHVRVRRTLQKHALPA